jgi:predicted aspartyl protease
MIRIKEIAGLPFVEATVTFRGQSMKLENVLIDTGSAGTIFNVIKLEEIGCYFLSSVTIFYQKLNNFILPPS